MCNRISSGKGAFGVVKLAVNKKTGSRDAVKSISKAKLVCKEDVKDVQAEVAIMNLVAGHPHVVSLKSTHEDKDYVHLAMELCGGGELFDSIVEAGNFSEKKAAKVFRKMVDVVNHCHELGVMHRDLKPENFLLTSKVCSIQHASAAANVREGAHCSRFCEDKQVRTCAHGGLLSVAGCLCAGWWSWFEGR
ncbi:kinase-like domain-containing protein [Dunaliella salina]|uniref:Kinase-like domain-containing protein n=1 Tax=Dunaliella salina TaxID=3046 RepID=A0ABQ7FUK6_DUNSA|nr:kinase-like domain-containing protein [Dunaliella salina]|eukprot:KAF5826098.1 kinase-like domain-containing protein [Dunaliella salina]